jgi:hypothetical protein
MRLRFEVLLLAGVTLCGPALARVEMSTDQAKLIRVRWAQAQWTGLAPDGPLGRDEQTMFLISGELENVGGQPIAWVKLRFDLLDDGYEVLASEYGYNRGAEALREPAIEKGEAAAEALHIPAIEPGQADGFRMTFFRADVPRFTRWRVKVLEVKPASAR